MIVVECVYYYIIDSSNFLSINFNTTIQQRKISEFLSIIICITAKNVVLFQ